MNACLFRGLMFSGLVGASVCVPLIAGEVVLQKVPPLTVEQAPAYPENLARYHSGAALEVSPQRKLFTDVTVANSTLKDNGNTEAALLCSDPTIGYSLPAGTTNFIISLSRIENIDNVSLLNRGTKGHMTVAVSNTKLPISSSQWKEVSQQELSGNAIKSKIGPSEAKYVKLTFNVNDPGRISALGIYAAPNMAAFTMPRAKQSLGGGRSETFALISYNLTDVHTKARALYVSSGNDLKDANNMIDDQPSSTYSFGSQDSAPTAVIDLGKVTSLRRISAIYSARAGSMDFFVLRSLPDKAQAAVSDGKAETLPKTLPLNTDAFNAMQHVGSVSDGSGQAAVDFPETAGRYIVLKWTSAAEQSGPFTVAEVAAFGGNKNGSLLAANTIGSNAEQTQSDGKSVQDGKDLGEGKDIPSEGPAAPAEGPPPGLPDPPPFTFVPELLPTSP